MSLCVKEKLARSKCNRTKVVRTKFTAPLQLSIKTATRMFSVTAYRKEHRNCRSNFKLGSFVPKEEVLFTYTRAPTYS